MQLASKMRFISAQFEVLLGGGLWLQNASHANEMAALLAGKLEHIGGVGVVHPVEANAVFAQVPRPTIEPLLRELPGEHPFYVWDDAENVIRLMCSWDTTPEDVDGLVAALEGAIAA
jgi:threonine aldolase